MLTKKAIIVLLLFVGIGVSGIKAQTIYVKEKGGTQTSYSLNDIRKITFSQSALVINNKDGNLISYLLSNLRYLNFINLSSEVPRIDLPEVSSLILYPNPAGDKLYFNLSKPENRIIRAEVVSLAGRVILYKTFDEKSVESLNSIDIAPLSEGMYLCRIISEGKFFTGKFYKKY